MPCAVRTPPRWLTRSTAHTRLRNTASPPLALPPDSPSIIASFTGGKGACAPAKAGANSDAASDFKTWRRAIFIRRFPLEPLKRIAQRTDARHAAITVKAAQWKGPAGTVSARRIADQDK